MTDSSAFKVDLTNCDREPIHVLGNIQPFGFLITVGADWHVTRASINLDQFIGVAPGEAIGQPLLELFSEKAVHSIRNRITLLRGPYAVERLFYIALIEGGPLFDLALHFSGGQVVIEAEPSAQEEIEASAMVRAMVARLNQSEGMTAYFRSGRAPGARPDRVRPGDGLSFRRAGLGRSGGREPQAGHRLLSGLALSRQRHSRPGAQALSAQHLPGDRGCECGAGADCPRGG